MRQTTEYRSYIGTRTALSRHGRTRICSSLGRRSGFTLVEVVVAFAIMFVLVLGLSAGFAYSQRVFHQAQLSAMAQNLLDLQVEDLRSMSADTLLHLVDGSHGVDTALVNYPRYSVAGVDPDGDATWYAYDQSSDTDPATKGVFYVINLVDTVERPDGTLYTAPVAVGSDLLLGSSVTVQPVPQVLPAKSYYNILFFQDMYPTLARRIRVRQVLTGEGYYSYEYSVAILTPNPDAPGTYKVLEELTGLLTPLATGG